MEEYSYTSTHPLGHTLAVAGSLYIYLYEHVVFIYYRDYKAMYKLSKHSSRAAENWRLSQGHLLRKCSDISESRLTYSSITKRYKTTVGQMSLLGLEDAARKHMSDSYQLKLSFCL